MTFSSAVICGNRLNCWNTMPASRRISRTWAASPFTLRPSTSRSPPLIVSSTLIHRRNVDLPEPEGPTTTTTSPASMFSEMPFSTMDSPKFLVTL
ncbi:hypothetical protein D3C72_1809610 [compost metagenome]